ncbi:MAG TPA: DUF1553 domain-containing protein, partial [Humisphaera sp.]
SATYQQASTDNAAARAADPDNNLLWHHARKRVDFEAVRDGMLAAAGELNPAVYGRPVEVASADERRRTIYGFIDRQNLPSVYRSFDFAGPDTHAPQRFNTTVPQQGLFFLNSPFAQKMAARTLERPDVKKLTDAAAKVDRLYRILYGRPPTADEVVLAKAFVENEGANPTLPPPPPAGAAWSYGYGVIDPKAQRVTSLTPLPYKGKTALRAAMKLPDAKLGFLTIDANGGHPDKNAVIRRFTAPAAGTLTVDGTLNHPADNGDGVTGLVVSSRLGVVAKWHVRHDKAATAAKLQVEAGDTVDFVVEAGPTNTSDSFQWSPKLKLAGPKVPGGELTYDAARDFADSLSAGVATPAVPAMMGAWEKYVQVLMAGNEFVFVE